MKQCQICYKNIPTTEYVELLIEQYENYKYILGKYKWFSCNYCFECLNISRKLIWGFYINILLSSDCKNTLITILKEPIPQCITDNLRLNGKPIKALFYKGKMHTSRLITGMNDFQFYTFKEKLVVIYKSLLASLLQSENMDKKINDLQTLLANIDISGQ